MDIKKTDSEFIAATYKKFDLVLVRGEGSLLYDENGKEYIDLTSGIAVNTFGICDEVWKKAVTDQLDMLAHTSNLYYTEPAAKLAELLCGKSGMKKVFFSNSGAEANECAIKAARKYSSDKYGADTGRNKIITLKESFHGRTIATLSATGQDVFHKDFGPFVDGFEYAEPDCTEEIMNLMSDPDCCAVMLELIQGEGGIRALDAEYVSKVVQKAKENDILVIIDEVQSGNGRTGYYFSYQMYGIEPDIVTTAKGLGGGLPIGAALFAEKTKDVLGVGSHGSTFGGNLICAAGAVSIAERIDEKLLAEVRRKSEYLFSQLQSCSGVVSVSGAGFMIGVQTSKDVSEAVSKLIEKGVLVLTAKDKIRLLPALNIPDELLKKAAQTIKEVLS